jgi:tetratricopeptide (TPR) repeat protein
MGHSRDRALQGGGRDERLLGVYPPLGSAYRHVGQRAQARTVLEEGWALAQGPWRGLGPGIFAAGGIARGLAQLDFAERNYQATVARCTQSVAAFDAVLSLAMAGRAETELGRFAEAEAAFDRALKIATQRRLREVELNVTHALGTLALARREWPRALALFDGAIAQATQSGRTHDLTWLEAGRARALDGLGRIDDALEAARALVGHVEAVRGDLSGPELRSGFLDGQQDVYHEAVRLALKAGKPDEAFALAERSRARAFLDLLGSHAVLSKGQTRALVSDEMRLRAQLAEASARAQDAEEHGESDATRRLVDAAEREYAAFLERVRKENREQASLMSVEPVTVSEIQALLPEDTSLLEYLVDDRAVIVWVVDRARLTVY